MNSFHLHLLMLILMMLNIIFSKRMVVIINSPNNPRKFLPVNLIAIKMMES
jgi:hypothetical protein